MYILRKDCRDSGRPAGRESERRSSAALRQCGRPPAAGRAHALGGGRRPPEATMMSKIQTAELGTLATPEMRLLIPMGLVLTVLGTDPSPKGGGVTGVDINPLPYTPD